MHDGATSSETLAMRELLVARRDEFQVLLGRYGATHPMLFGPAARGTARPGSDIDILVEMDPADGVRLTAWTLPTALEPGWRPGRK